MPEFLVLAQILHFVSAMPVLADSFASVCAPGFDNVVLLRGNNNFWEPRFVALVDAVGVHGRFVELVPRVPPGVYR